jgi:hypothetical protein
MRSAGDTHDRASPQLDDVASAQEDRPMPRLQMAFTAMPHVPITDKSIKSTTK